LYTLPPPFGLRSVSANDQAFLNALYASSRDDLQLWGVDPNFVSQLIKSQQQVQMAGFQNAYPHAAHWVMECDGQPIGRVVVNTMATDVRVVDIAVHPASRRQGAARAVLQALQTHAAQTGRSLSLAVAKTNAGARQLYDALGFALQSEDLIVEQRMWRAHSAR
jgi:ribosomal protein S18 acetylase RimI-like enzyme